MSYLVLARKWRPQNFDEVEGQEHITRTLKNAVKMGRVPHALLFSGPRGVGKTTMARLLAKALNCEKGATENPCQECSSCKEITKGSSMDVLEIDGASNTGVDDVRQLRESVQYRPSSSRYRIYIIDEVHMLSRGAFNALLKTLEEPPEHVFFIFATTEPHKVPLTIQSRCQRFDFRRIAIKAIVSRLKQIAGSEGIKIQDSGLGLIARQAEGSMRDAISILDQAVSFTGKEISDEKLNELLALVSREHLFNLTRALVMGQARPALEILDLVYEQGYDLKQFLKELIEHFRNLIVAKFVVDDTALVELNDAEIAELKAQANLANEEALGMIFEFLLQAEERMARTEHPKVVLELALVKSASLKQMLLVEELIDRLEQLKTDLKSSSSALAREDFELKPNSNPVEPEKAEDKTDSGINKNQLDSSPKTWEGFMGFVSQGSPSLAELLKNGKFLGQDQQKLKLGFAQDDFCLKVLQDPDRLNSINQLLSQYFGQAVELSCEFSEEEKLKSTKNQSEHYPGLAKEELRKKLMEHPLVEKAREIFEASLEEIKIK